MDAEALNLRSASLILAAVALLSGCAFPTHNPWKLRAIGVEAASLAAHHPVSPTRQSISIPANEWPPNIASLKPEFVTVFSWGVDITVKPYFDGGWGYQIARNKRDLPMPEECYSDLGQGIFWHGPC